MAIEKLLSVNKKQPLKRYCNSLNIFSNFKGKGKEEADKGHLIRFRRLVARG
jgi:hypothetical protein